MFEEIESILLQHKKFTKNQVQEIFDILKKHNHIDNSKILLSSNEDFSNLSDECIADLIDFGFKKHQRDRVEKTLKKLHQVMKNSREFDVILYSQETGKPAIVESKYFDLRERPKESMNPS